MSGLLRLYLVRHGQTAWNAIGRYQGQLDVPLDDVGRRQVAALRPRLSGVPFAAVYASALRRAGETAALLLAPVAGDTRAGRGGEGGPSGPRPAHARSLAEADQEGIVGLAAFNEMSYGDWEGHTRDEIAALFPQNWARYQADPATERPSGGETRAELHARVTGALREILASHRAGGQVLLAAHGGTLRAIVAEVLGLDLRGYRHLHFDNASLSIVDLRARAERPTGTVLLLDDTAHLEPVKAMPEAGAV